MYEYLVRFSLIFNAYNRINTPFNKINWMVSTVALLQFPTTLLCFVLVDRERRRIGNIECS